jgi:glucose-1-phosphate cytidylyltransferase
MKVVILAGGLGTRLGEETKSKPKPMINIGKDPILMHIINIYKNFNQKEFLIAGGYKFNVIKKFFEKKKIKDLKVEVVDTGNKSMTGGRIYKLKKYITEDQFMLTYGDGLANINIDKLLHFHNLKKRDVTMTVVRPPARWGHVTLNKNLITKFDEKNQLNEGWINGGFFVFEVDFFKYFKNFKNKNKIILEKDILPIIAKKKRIAAYKHTGFWQCMDTLRDKLYLTKLSKKKNLLWMKF